MTETPTNNVNYLASGDILPTTEETNPIDKLSSEFSAWCDAQRYGDESLESQHTREVELLRNIYDISRGIGDSVLGSSSEKVRKLLEHSVVPTSFRSRAESSSWLGSVHNRASIEGVNRAKILNIDMSLLGSQAEIIKNKLNNRGMKLPIDTIKFFQLIRTVAHESAHILQVGVGKLAGIHSSDSVDFLSKQTRIQDTGALNEGFAEGYAEIVLKSILEERGYSKPDTNTIIDAMSHRGNTTKIDLGYLAMSPQEMVVILEMGHDKIKEDNDW